MMNPPLPPTKTQKAASVYKTIKGELRSISSAVWVIVGVLLGWLLGEG